MSHIRNVVAREILDSRGNPTVEVEVHLADGSAGRAAVPSGASTGDREAVELRDRNLDRYSGKGVLNAAAHVHREIAAAVIGQEASDQEAIDALLIAVDGTPNKSRLGANAILGVSMATARAAAASVGLALYRYLRNRDSYSLPVPTVNVVNGGAHAGNALDFQEFMLVPVGAPTMADGVRWCAETFHRLKDLLTEAGHSTSVGDEGGYAPNLTTADEALDLLMRAIERAGYRPGTDISLSMDPATSELFSGGLYEFRKSGRPPLTTAEMIDLMHRLADCYPLVFIEDGLSEHDWEGWAELTRRLGSRLLLVGDDIFVTNPAIIKEGIARRIGNAALIKLNQIGTVTETLEAIAVSHAAGYQTVISHRSGETEDTFIADLAVAAESAYIKTGSMARSERVAKYNQLMRIESELGSQAAYGRAARRRESRPSA